MKYSFGFLSIALALVSADICYADLWRSRVIAQCFALKDRAYDTHFFVRIFWTEVGGGQLKSGNDRLTGLLSLDQLSRSPVTCSIDGKVIRLEVQDYRAPALRGACGLCEQTGFRLMVEDTVIWETPAPAVRGDPIFNGTIDMDKDMARVCTEHRPLELGVDLPYEPDFFESRTSILVCQTQDY